MSLETNNAKVTKTKQKKKLREQQEESEQTAKRKHHSLANSQPIEESPRKKPQSGKSKTAVPDPQSIDPDCSEHSPFHLQTFSLYLPLSPICQLYPLQGLCAEHVSPLTLTYYPPVRGVILSYSNPELSEEPNKHGGAEDQGTVLAISVAEFAVSFIWLTVDFLVFKPQRGGWLEGWVNLQSEDHVGLVCWNLFNASIERKRLPKEWRWVVGDTRKKSTTKLKNSQEDLQSEDEEDAVQDVPGTDDAREDEGYFEDGQGNKIEGSIRFRVRDLDASMSTDREKSFLSIEGTLLSTDEEGKLIEQEELAAQGGRGGFLSRSGREYTMSGALGDSQANSIGDQDRDTGRKSKHRISY
ncbi:hypothetical protein MMC30_004162 [Trapelia coarctata]|nr:hypothetical protein [Trapelia coarctata]